MGSILSQAGQKCYRQPEKSSRGGRVRGILRADSLLLASSACVRRGFSVGKPAFAFLFATKIEEIRSNSPQRPRNTPLRPASLEAS